MSQKGPGESCFAKREKESSSPWNRDDLRPLAAKLYTKMVAAYGDTSWIAKSGKNEQQGYKFARAEDMYHQCREAFAKHGLAIRVITKDLATTERARANKDPLYHTIMQVNIQVIDSETGYRETTPWYGECIESGDKAISKCLTAALKYFLRTQLMIPTGDDPDATTPEPTKPAQKPAAKNGKTPKFPGSGEYLKYLALSNEQVDEFKSICAAKNVPWGQIALEAKERGILSFLDLKAYVEDGVIPEPPSLDELATEIATQKAVTN